MKIRYSRATSDGAMYKNGVLGVKNGRFDAAAGGEELDLTQYLVCPGFIDMHTHGGAGIDSMKTNAEGLSQLSMHYASCGVAVFHPTTVTATLDDMLRAIEMTKAAMQTGTRGACINGIYLEGPYLSAKYRGAHEEALLRDPDMAELDRLLAAADGIIRVVTIAPERAGALAAISHLRAHGVRVSLGHSAATQQEAEAAINAGGNIAVHTYNAMAPLNHRNVGLLGMSLGRDDVYNELICDLIHVCPEALRLVYLCKNPKNIILITDSMDATGMSDGQYQLGNLSVTVTNGVARTETGALAGSTLRSNIALRNVVTALGIPVETAVMGLTCNPASALGQPDIGTLQTGARAHLTALDENFNVVLTMVDGNIVYDARA